MTSISDAVWGSRATGRIGIIRDEESCGSSAGLLHGVGDILEDGEVKMR